MTDSTNTHYWIDVSARIGGDDPDLAFRTAVHLAIYAAQDFCDGPIISTTHPGPVLTRKLLRGVPLSEDQILELGTSHWPPMPEAFSLNHMPRCVPVSSVKNGKVMWNLDDTRLSLTYARTLDQAEFTHNVEIVAGSSPIVRQRVKLTGVSTHTPGTPKSFKLMAAVCGLFDGVTRFTPEPFLVNDEEGVERFLNIVEDPNRQQPVIAIAADDSDLNLTWLPEVDTEAKASFMVQHVAAVTENGRHLLNEMLGPHRMERGAIKTFRAGFSVLDIPGQHPATSRGATANHCCGRPGMLRRWRNRLMTSDAFERSNVALLHGPGIWAQ